MVKVHVCFQMSRSKRELGWPSRISVCIPMTISSLICSGTGCTGFITEPSWLLHFEPTKMVGRKCFVPLRYQLRRGISLGPALKYFCMIHRVGRSWHALGLFVCFFVFLFVAIKPEKLYSASCWEGSNAGNKTDYSRGKSAQICKLDSLPKSASSILQALYCRFFGCNLHVCVAFIFVFRSKSPPGIFSNRVGRVFSSAKRAGFWRYKIWKKPPRIVYK